MDDISTVLPREVEELRIVAGKDYCTLVTCTPYGINTHRLLVRGHRVALPDNTELPTAQEKMQGLDWKIKLLAVIVAILLLLGIFSLWRKRKRKKRKKREYGEQHPENWEVVERIAARPADRATADKPRSPSRTHRHDKKRKPHD